MHIRGAYNLTYPRTSRQRSRAARFTGVLALACAALHGISLAQDAQAVIGATLPLTGAASTYGRELAEGARACIAATPNARGVRLEVLDDTGDSARTVQNLARLAANDRVLLVLGTLGTEATHAAIQALEEARLPMVGPSTGSESLRALESPYLFYLRASHIDEAAAIVNQLAELGIGEAAIVHSADALGEEGLQGTRIEMARLALKPSVVLKLDRTGSMTAAGLASLVKAAPPAVIVIAPQVQAAQFIQELRSTSLRPTVTAVSEAAGEALFEKVGPAARGIGLAQVMPHPWSANLPVTRFYQAAMKDAHQEKLGYYSLEGCVQVRIALEALRRAARPLRRDRLAVALEGEFDLGGMRFQFAPGKRRGGRFVEMTVINHNGRVAR